MLVNEIYGLYYYAVSEVLDAALQKARLENGLSQNDVAKIIGKNTFDDMPLQVTHAISAGGKWQLLDGDGKSVLKNETNRPLTKLEKEWMKSLLSDPRIQLFEPDVAGLEEVESLFQTDDFVYFDQFQDGDPFLNEQYIQIFRSLLRAIKTHTSMKIRYQLKDGRDEWRICHPIRMEYSQRDDKFRVLSSVNGKSAVFNVAKILECLPGEPYSPEECKTEFHNKRSVELLVKDTGRILERLLIQFSIYKRETECIENHTYKVRLEYEAEDESDILIKVLSFGPGGKVVAPSNFIKKIKRKLEMQNRCEPI